MRIDVSKPFLPKRQEYEKYLKEIFERNWLTNHGPLVLKLESELQKKLNVTDLQYTTNGTIALQLAIKGLELKGEVITTPFSYVATTSSIVWEKCKPVFADINRDSFNIDPEKIEQLINDSTTGILATHVFGNACEVEKIQTIANRYNLKVIYDSAHAFGVKYNGKSILKFGDVSTLSFHATKMFHTVEGGAVISSSAAIDQKIQYLKNFGHDGYEAFHGLGINGKNSEFHAAMGLCNLKYIDDIRKKYKDLYELYSSSLKSAYQLKLQSITPNCEYNYAYFPIVFESETQLLEVKKQLEQEQIFPRRYFYPSLSTLPYVSETKLPIADQISKTILCLPMYYQLSNQEVEKICSIIISSLIDG